MPELPEVETVKKDLLPLIGKRILKVQKSKKLLRKPLTSALLKNKTITDISRWGKKLIINLDQGYLDISLGMTGSFKVEKAPLKKETHDHVFLFLDSGQVLIFNDSRRFGWVTYSPEIPQFKGYDPILSPVKTFKVLVEQASLSSKNIYNFLMDQNKVAGLGNIYVQEILFDLKVSPLKNTNKLNTQNWKDFKKISQKVLKNALDHGGSTIINYKSLNGKSGNFQTKLKVYGRVDQPCKICKTKIKKIKIASRSICYCPQCQNV